MMIKTIIFGGIVFSVVVILIAWELNTRPLYLETIKPLPLETERSLKRICEETYPSGYIYEGSGYCTYVGPILRGGFITRNGKIEQCEQDFCLPKGYVWYQNGDEGAKENYVLEVRTRRRIDLPYD